MIYHGDLFDVLPTLEAESIDACVTDPPYELAFMGKAWDARGVAFNPETWRQVYRVLKPGAHLVSFGGTRTFHRMTCAIEDAGFEIRDCLCWLYGSGFPKSLNVSKAIDSIRDWTLVERLAAEIRRAREASGMTLQGIGKFMREATGGQYGAWYHRGGHMFFETGRSLPSRPEWEQLRRLLPISDEFRSVYEAAERQVIGRSANGIAGGTGKHAGEASAYGFAGEFDITAPATDAAKQWNGWGTALKPSYEPVVLARKPIRGTVAQNVQTHGTGAINVDACRIAGEPAPSVPQWRSAGSNNNWEADGRNGSMSKPHDLGRWPPNVLLDEEAAALLDEQTGELSRPGNRQDGTYVVGHGSNVLFNDKTTAHGSAFNFGDSGGASRFYYVAKPSREERDYGCSHLTARTGGEATDRKDGSAGVNSPRAGAGRTGGSRNVHPTVKPVELMRWLVRLVTPPDGVVLDPFTGSGTTGMACRYEHRRFIGIEREAEYVQIAEARIAAVAPLFGEHSA